MQPLQAMDDLSGQLGRHHFQTFAMSPLRTRGAGSAVISNNTITGSYNTLIASPGITPEDQLANAMDLTGPFVEGLEAVARGGAPVVCLDGYDSAPWLTRRWIARALVGPIISKGCARLILTGRSPPDELLHERAPDLCAVHLKGIHDPKEWVQLARRLGCALPGKTMAVAVARLEGVISFTKGEPGAIMQWLQDPART